MLSKQFFFFQWVALRQLNANRSKQGLSFMTIISVAGVAVGVTILIVVLSVMGGFEQDLKTKMLNGQPHMEILASNEALGFSLLDVPVDSFQSKLPDSIGMAPYTQADVVAKHGKHLAAISLIGVDSREDNNMWGFARVLSDDDLATIDEEHSPLLSFDNDESKFPGILLGEGVAGQLGADIGDEVTVLSPQAASGAVIFSGGTISRTYVVSGLFSTRMFDYDSRWAVVRLDEGRKFMTDYDPSLDLEKFVTGIGISLNNPLDVSEAKRQLALGPNLAVKTWEDSNAALLFALLLEKYTMGAILMLIVLVAAFSISGTMMMTVFHKKTQVCLLRSLGMNQSDIARLFILQGFLIGVIGIIFGLLFGLGICFGIEQFRFIDVPSSLLSIRNLPVRYLPLEYSFICLFALILTIVGALYPAVIASRQNPSTGLRYS
ncbi:MAG: ABC transporter permease [Pseudobacteriovorax sp.]|nr:ABC transporter permease [Pseudobacteriovorax sp.]